MWNGFVHSPLTYYLRKKNKNWSFANWWLILCRFLRQSRIDRFRVKWLSPFVRLQWKFLIWFQIQFAHSAVGSWWYLLNATRWPELVSLLTFITTIQSSYYTILRLYNCLDFEENKNGIQMFIELIHAFWLLGGWS